NYDTEAGRPCLILWLIESLELQHFEYYIDNDAEDDEVDEHRKEITDLERTDGPFCNGVYSAGICQNRIDDVVHKCLYEALCGASQDEADCQSGHAAL